MCCKSLFAVAGLAAVAGSIAFAQPAKESKPAKPASPAATKPAAQPEQGKMPAMSDQQMKDMQACIEAATPGQQHAHMAKNVGTWTGGTKMWMAPDTEPTSSTASCTISTVMDGRYIKTEFASEMPGMGMFSGFGINGFDNVSQKFVSTWIDNMSTGIMTGTGELSADGKVMTWNFTYNCPITKKPTTMREVETQTSPDSFTLEMFGKEPHSGKEYKMMEITMKRQPSVKAID